MKKKYFFPQCEIMSMRIPNIFYTLVPQLGQPNTLYILAVMPFVASIIKIFEIPVIVSKSEKWQPTQERTYLP